MAGSASIGGLSSGLDTAALIDQLIALEKVPQNRLRTRVTAEQQVVTSLQGVNTRTALLGSAAEALATPARWSPVTTTSSNADVAVTTGAGVAPQQLTVTVTGVARTHQLGFAATAALTDVVTGSGTRVRIDRFDGTPLELETGDGTLRGLVAAVNDPANATGLRATAVRTGDGAHRLLVESLATGAAQDFALTAADGSTILGGATERAGSDATLDLGAGITATSASGTFADLAPGLTVTLGPGAEVGEVATLTVARDTAGVTASVKAVVDAFNATVGEIKTQTAYDSVTGTAARLAGDSTLRSLRNALLQSVYPADGTTLADVGLELDRTGKLVFDEAAFKAAYTADPAAVAARFTGTGGFATAVARVADEGSDPVDGSISVAVTGRRAGIDRLTDSIEAWDRRLEVRRDALSRQFTALETALGQMASQSSWLAGQLGSLPSWG